MINLLKKIKKVIFKEKTLDINYKFWPTNKCYDCKQVINNIEPGCWYKFVQIGNEVFRVPQCDDCSNKQSKIYKEKI